MRACRQITTLVSELSRRESWRLELGTGEVVKGRIVESVGRAEEIDRLLAGLTELPFSRIRHRRADALLEQWVAGVPLPADSSDESVAEEAGSILGRLHRVPAAPSKKAGLQSVAVRLRRLETCLSRLVAQRGISEAERQKWLDLARRDAPREVRVGLIHQDLCAENIVQTRDGLVVVDNELLEIGPLEHDLARTWYRWPGLDRSAFLRGYEKFGSAASFLAHQRFWHTATLLLAAEYRLSIGLGAGSILARARIEAGAPVRAGG